MLCRCERFLLVRTQNSPSKRRFTYTPTKNVRPGKGCEADANSGTYVSRRKGGSVFGGTLRGGKPANCRAVAALISAIKRWRAGAAVCAATVPSTPTVLLGQIWVRCCT